MPSDQPSPVPARPEPAEPAGPAGPAVPLLADPRQRRAVLWAVCLALMAVVASVSGLNVAQPELASTFTASQEEVLWIINTYTLTLAALLLPLPAGAQALLLVDERAGMPRRIMRFLIEGDDHRGPNNAGVVIPSGVAHALRVEGGDDAIMVYGTTTKFNPEFEGRIADSVERAPLPHDWQRYIDASAR